MQKALSVGQEIYVLPSYFPVPVLGVLPVNAFVIKGAQPVLVDTGLPGDREEFTSAVSELVDLDDLRWLWLTHTDPDHTGSLLAILQAFPQVRLITTFIGAGKLSVFAQIPPERTYLLNPGQTLDVGDRILTAVRPPTYDAPETTGFVDSKSGAFFCADCFGGVVGPGEDAAAIPERELASAQVLWVTLDSPWIHAIDRAVFATRLNEYRQLSSTMVLSSHLPPARGLLDTFLRTLQTVPDAPPFVGPDQIAMERMMAQTSGAPAQ